METTSSLAVTPDWIMYDEGYSPGQGNVTMTTTSRGPGYYTALVVMATVSVTAVVGNVCNIFVILRSASLRHTLSNFFVVSLCTSDLLAAVLVMPLAASTFALGRWPLGELECDVTGFISSLLMFVSMTTLCAISVERFYSIKFPMHHAAHMSLGKTLCAVFLVWGWAAVLATLPLLGLGSYDFRQHRYHCSFTWQEQGASQLHKLYVAIVATVCFVIPGLVLLAMYAGIFRVAKTAATKVGPVSPGSGVRTLRIEVRGSVPINGVSPSSTVTGMSFTPRSSVPTEVMPCIGEEPVREGLYGGKPVNGTSHPVGVPVTDSSTRSKSTHSDCVKREESVIGVPPMTDSSRATQSESTHSSKIINSVTANGFNGKCPSRTCTGNSAVLTGWFQKVHATETNSQANLALNKIVVDTPISAVDSSNNFCSASAASDMASSHTLRTMSCSPADSLPGMPDTFPTIDESERYTKSESSSSGLCTALESARLVEEQPGSAKEAAESLKCSEQTRPVQSDGFVGSADFSEPENGSGNTVRTVSDSADLRNSFETVRTTASSSGDAAQPENMNATATATSCLTSKQFDSTANVEQSGNTTKEGNSECAADKEYSYTEGTLKAQNYADATVNKGHSGGTNVPPERPIFTITSSPAAKPGMATNTSDVSNCYAKTANSSQGTSSRGSDSTAIDFNDASTQRLNSFKPLRNHLKAAKTLLVLLAAYTLLWGPFFVLHVHGVIHDRVEAPETTEIVALWLGFGSFAVNPFLYGWMNKAIREELICLYRRLFCSWCCCKRCPCRPELQDDLLGLADEDFFQFLERTSQACSKQVDRHCHILNRGKAEEERDAGLDSSDVIAESSGPF